MLLYVIEAEVLASFINANKSMNGIQTGDYENKMIYFADNTTIFLILLSLGGKGVWGGRGGGWSFLPAEDVNLNYF